MTDTANKNEKAGKKMEEGAGNEKGKVIKRISERKKKMRKRW